MVHLLAPMGNKESMGQALLTCPWGDGTKDSEQGSFFSWNLAFPIRGYVHNEQTETLPSFNTYFTASQHARIFLRDPPRWRGKPWSQINNVKVYLDESCCNYSLGILQLHKIWSRHFLTFSPTWTKPEPDLVSHASLCFKQTLMAFNFFLYNSCVVQNNCLFKCSIIQPVCACQWVYKRGWAVTFQDISIRFSH